MTGFFASCPTGCTRKVDPGKLMCRPCWAKVPQDLQKRVYATWRAWRKDFGNEQAMLDYDTAKENAIASIA